jgi:hypothetical protein
MERGQYYLHISVSVNSADSPGFYGFKLPDFGGCRLADNPLADFVELPPAYATDLRYSNLVCGAVRGALEMVG